MIVGGTERRRLLAGAIGPGPGSLTITVPGGCRMVIEAVTGAHNEPVDQMNLSLQVGSFITGEQTYFTGGSVLQLSWTPDVYYVAESNEIVTVAYEGADGTAQCDVVLYGTLEPSGGDFSAGTT